MQEAELGYEELKCEVRRLKERLDKLEAWEGDWAVEPYADLLNDINDRLKKLEAYKLNMRLVLLEEPRERSSEPRPTAARLDISFSELLKILCLESDTACSMGHAGGVEWRARKKGNGVEFSVVLQ